MKIAHITPHLGGGVGQVLLNYLARVQGGPDKHELWCLDYANPQARARADREGLVLRDSLGLDHGRLAAAVRRADIVVAHWWNHPLLYAWFMGGLIPPCRLLLWSHVSGLAEPQVFTPALAAFPDLFAVATPHSFTSPVWQDRPMAGRAAHPRLLFSCAGLEHVARAEPRPHPGFRVGYLGTVDYVKMHPGFLDMCLAADLPEARFAVAGGPKDRELAREAEAKGAAGRFEILGQISDIESFLSSLDVFGYPLNPRHYGTGEQCLIEAQAAGAPPVVLAGGAEEYVVEDGLTGLVAKNEADYSRCLERLYHDRELRLALSARARARARERFDIDSMVQGFEALYAELMARPKSHKAWPGNPGPGPARFSPAEIFLSSQGGLGRFFAEAGPGLSGPERTGELFSRLNITAYSETRGSVFHYLSFFPEDRGLKHWAALLRGREGTDAARA
jgi:glycosyltransferase involved in cell wall biosynthesis